jgi:nucleoside-diphosphate-sugar epimerase
MKRILVTGAGGQIGSELVPYLRSIYGESNVLATDVKAPEGDLAQGPFDLLDVRDGRRASELIGAFKADTVIHMAGILSAKGEENPNFAWDINVNGTVAMLEAAREHRCAFFFPSSIAAFGPTTPLVHTPQDTIQRPTTVYGIAKASMEMLCDYYHLKFNLDTRGLRFPGLISYVTPPGGGTTDYAVHIYYDAITKGSYTSFIAKGTYMDMMYMPDALEAIVQLMEADPSKLKHRNAFNISAMSFDPEEIAQSIRKVIPDFKLEYDVDPLRQSIAESWPDSLDCSAAREEWGFAPKYDLDRMTVHMLEKLKERLVKA